MAHLYYLPEVDTSWNIGDSLTVTGDEARHAVKVSRLQRDETILIGDGGGTIARCKVHEVTGSTFSASIIAVNHEEHERIPVTLVQALAKGDRAERAVEQATEFGVSNILPWQAERSVSRWNTPEKQRKGQTKWQRVAREAAKQSIRARIPVVSQLADIRAVVNQGADDETALFVLDPWAEHTLHETYSDLLSKGRPLSRVTIVVGPEGGITENELAEFKRHDARIVKLGPHVLRTSSAGPAALALIHTLNHTW